MPARPPATAPAGLPPHLARWVFACGLLIAAVLAVQLLLSGMFSWSEALLLATTDTLPWFLAVPGVIWLAVRFPLDGGHRWRHGLLHLGAALLCSALLPLAALGLWHSLGVDPLPGHRGPPPGPPPGMDRMRPPGPPPLWHLAAGRAPFHWPMYALIVAAVHGWRAAAQAQERGRRAAELERLLIEARLTSLTRQLHPHFLFNTLNTIAEFVRSDPARAEEMVIDLSELLHHALLASDHHVVPLAEELTLLDRYLDIQRARFGDRLRFEKRIAPGSLDALVPVLLLQPLVENAMRHGLDRSHRPVTVVLEARVFDNWIHVVVRDDASPAPDAAPSAGGIGLTNLRDRLAVLYGPAQRFAAGADPAGGFAVEFAFPVRPSAPASIST